MSRAALELPRPQEEEEEAKAQARTNVQGNSLIIFRVSSSPIVCGPSRGTEAELQSLGPG